MSVSIAAAAHAGAQTLDGPSAVGRWSIDDSRFVAVDAHDSRVLFIVLHFTNESFDTSARLLQGPHVSSHYLVSDEAPPRIYRLVPEHRRAWHAGDSRWGAHAGLNASSIGIEIVNRGDHVDASGQRVFASFGDAQIDAVVALVRDIAARHGVLPERVLGHSDIAPQRKVDPGPRFPWVRLAEAGVVRWPQPAERLQAERELGDAALPGVAWFQQALARLGFAQPVSGRLDEPTRRVVAAFQMKYRPARHDGQPDRETAVLLRVLSGEPWPAGVAAGDVR